MKIFQRKNASNDPFEGIENGDRVRDMITGYEGVVTGRVEYIAGCNQVMIVPKADGKEPQSHWFDIERVELLDKAEVKFAERLSGGELPPPERQGPR